MFRRVVLLLPLFAGIVACGQGDGSGEALDAAQAGVAAIEVPSVERVTSTWSINDQNSWIEPDSADATIPAPADLGKALESVGVPGWLVQTPTSAKYGLYTDKIAAIGKDSPKQLYVKVPAVDLYFDGVPCPSGGAPGERNNPQVTCRSHVVLDAKSLDLITVFEQQVR